MTEARTGYLLGLQRSPWNMIEKRARNSIRKARKYLKVRSGTLSELEAMHWSPGHLPLKLSKNHRIYTATIDGQPVASMLVELRSWEHQIIYRYAASDPCYSWYNGNSLLIWHIVDEYGDDPEYDYLNLGGSGNEGIDRFKRQFATCFYSYPHKGRTVKTRLRHRLTKWLPRRVKRTISTSGRIGRMFARAKKIAKQPTSNRRIHISCDDLNHMHLTKCEQIGPFIEVHESYPSFTVTFFAVPHGLAETPWPELLMEDWVRVGLHGYMHSSGELWNRMPLERMVKLLEMGLGEIASVGLKPACFKPPSYRCNGLLLPALSKSGIDHAFISNDQHKPLTDEALRPRRLGGVNIYPTNYSIRRRDEKRLHSIFAVNGYLSVQSHTADFPARACELWWLMERLEEQGGYMFERFN